VKTTGIYCRPVCTGQDPPAAGRCPVFATPRWPRKPFFVLFALRPELRARRRTGRILLARSRGRRRRESESGAHRSRRQLGRSWPPVFGIDLAPVASLGAQGAWRGSKSSSRRPTDGLLAKRLIAKPAAHGSVAFRCGSKAGGRFTTRYFSSIIALTPSTFVGL